MARDAMPVGGKLVFESRSAEAGGVVRARYAEAAFRLGKFRRRACRRTFADLGQARDFATRRRRPHRDVSAKPAARRPSKFICPGRASYPVRSDEASRKAGIEGGDEAVLVVEDDVLVRKYVVSQIQSLGYRTLAAGNAGEALAIIDENGKIDLLLTDVMMPGSINGRQLAVEALLRRPSLKVLYTSGYSENAMVDDG